MEQQPLKVARWLPYPFVFVGMALLVSGCRQAHDKSASAVINQRSKSPHHAIATSSPDAQREFDQGLMLIYAFDSDEAIRSFERAAQLDPQASMPHWGIALALGPSLNDPEMQGRMPRAFAEIERAVQSARDESALEQDYTQALAARYTRSDIFDLKQLSATYANAMRQLSAKYPRDADAATLLAESLMLAWGWPVWTEDGRPGDGIEEAIRVVESVLAREPQHIGANHYHIHLLDSSPTPERALQSARQLDALDTDSGHLRHMPSHVYMRLGDYSAAVASNLKAVAADTGHRDEHGEIGVNAKLRRHSRKFLAAAASMTGQFEVARQADESLFVLLRFRRWDDVLARPAPKDSGSILEWRIARVLALIGKRMLKEAEAERNEYGEAERALPEGTFWRSDPIEKVLPLARSEMAARFAWVRGDKAGAIRQWKRAVESEDQLTREEAVMPWFHPVRESLGAALYLDGQLAEAERVFREDLKIDRANGRSLFGLWHSLQAQGRMSEAQTVRQQFEKAWKDADVQLSMEGL